MKIAMIGHKYVPSREGGVEIVVEELSTRMANSEEVTIFNRKRKEYKKIDEHGFFYINETWIYKQLPTYDELLNDLKEL